MRQLYIQSYRNVSGISMFSTIGTQQGDYKRSILRSLEPSLPETL